MRREIAGAQPFYKALHAGGIRPGRSEGPTSEDAQGRRRRCQESTTIADTAYHRHAAQVSLLLSLLLRVSYCYCWPIACTVSVRCLEYRTSNRYSAYLPPYLISLRNIEFIFIFILPFIHICIIIYIV